MSKQIYHIGLLKGTGRVACWGNNHLSTTVIIQIVRDRDYLSPDIWQYLGPRLVTKQHIKNNKVKLLESINKQYATQFEHILID